MKDKSGTPVGPERGGNKYSDLERRHTLYIPNSYISGRMLDAPILESSYWAHLLIDGGDVGITDTMQSGFSNEPATFDGGTV
jgi:hypothetical protein